MMSGVVCCMGTAIAVCRYCRHCKDYYCRLRDSRVRFQFECLALNSQRSRINARVNEGKGGRECEFLMSEGVFEEAGRQAGLVAVDLIW